MAELNIGKHCGVKICHQLDFLPFQCSSCGLTLCKEHISRDNHECSHEKDDFSYPEFKGDKSYSCEFMDCTGRELLKVVCSACDKNFCLAHRHQVDHKCAFYEEPVKRMEQTAAHVQSILDKKKAQGGPVKKKTGRKSKATAAKVALMKMKMKAIGEKATPDTERIYLQIYMPIEAKMISKPMFFSKIWTIGRVVDKIASMAGLQNNNNVFEAKKLRLFDHDDGTLFENENSLQSIMDDDNILLNGGSVILEYVNNDIKELNNLEIYRC